MLRRRALTLAVLAGATLTLVYLLFLTVAPGVAAGALLYPSRRPVTVAPPTHCVDSKWNGESVALAGWRCDAPSAAFHGTVVLLHGIADNRASFAGTVARFRDRGFDVIAYDSRGHGDSTGRACTYGYWEKVDLRKVLDTARHGPIILIGSSLGGAVALQEAADDPRVTGIVAAEAFSDLETVARERAPRFLPDRVIRRAFLAAEALGHFRVADVRPMEAARRIRVPVLLIHGSRDVDTPPGHSKRIYDALAGPKTLAIIDGARHNESLRSPKAWKAIDEWIDHVVR